MMVSSAKPERSPAGPICSQLRGVRQGCMLSPLLYSIFINPIVQRINQLHLGVEIAGERTSILLYADDMVLIADNPNDMQRMLDEALEFSRDYAFDFNVDKTKAQAFYPSKTVRFAPHLGGVQIESVTQFRYLGIILQSNGQFKLAKADLLQRATTAMRRVLPFDPDHSCLTVHMREQIFFAKARSVIEYGCPIFGHFQWPSAEKMQVEAARRILRPNKTISNAVLIGDLGWISLLARRDDLRLRFWRRLKKMDKENRLIKRIFIASKCDAETFGKKCSNWVAQTQKVLIRNRAEHLWDVDDNIDITEECQNAVFKAEEDRWIQTLHKQNKLLWYRTHKVELKRELYIDHVSNPHQRKNILRLRAGCYYLRVEYGRYDKVDRENRLCLVCCSDEVETEEHFLLHCRALQPVRDRHKFNFPIDFGQSCEAIERLLCVSSSYTEDARKLLDSFGPKTTLSLHDCMRPFMVNAATFIQAICDEREKYRVMEAAVSQFWGRKRHSMQPISQ